MCVVLLLKSIMIIPAVAFSMPVVFFLQDSYIGNKGTHTSTLLIVLTCHTITKYLDNSSNGVFPCQCFFFKGSYIGNKDIHIHQHSITPTSRSGSRRPVLDSSPKVVRPSGMLRGLRSIWNEIKWRRYE